MMVMADLGPTKTAEVESAAAATSNHVSTRAGLAIED